MGLFRGSHALVAVVFAGACAAGLGACGVLSSGDCSDRAVCGETSPFADTGTGADVQFDALVYPDGPVADGECNGGAEDCSNDIDDNCNGLVDCADPVCQGGFSCAAPPPPGWQGPMSLWEAASGSAPTCPAPYATDALDGFASLTAPGANCTCTCPGIASGQKCTAVSVTTYNAACPTSNVCTTNLLAENICTPISCSNPAAGTAASWPATGGACTPSFTASVPPSAWGSTARACGYAVATHQGGCNGASQCLAKPSAPFGGPCVLQAGDVACPAGFPTKHSYATGVNDTRACDTCTCGTPSGAMCTASINYFTGTTCKAGGALLNILYTTGLCQDIGSSAAQSVVVDNFTTGSTTSTCSPVGGAAMGAATPTGTTTVCCQ